uniref:Shadow of prion protein n=1 Tax=Sphenodon punctatus TaxID=8508 RepID=A0A8D0GR39_SPHPU
MRRCTATCWTLILLAAFFCDNVACKGGRGGARGSARGSARGATRVRVKSAPRYGSSGTALRVAAAAAGGAAAGAAAGMAARRMRLAGESSPDDSDFQRGNSTGEGSYSYRAWISDAQPQGLLHLPAWLLCLATSFFWYLPF